MASINSTADLDGPTISLRLTKKEGIPVQFLKEGKETGAVITVRRVTEFGFYSLGATALAEKVGLTVPKSRAIVTHLKLRRNLECFRKMRTGKYGHASSLSDCG